MGVTAKAVEEGLELFVNHRVVLDHGHELGFLFGGWQLAVEQQVAGLEVIGLLGQLFDRVAAVQQNSVVTINVGDLRLARGRGHEARVKCEAAGGGQTAYVDHVRTHCTGQYWQLDGGSALDDQLRFFVSHVASYLCFKSSDRPPTQGPHHYSEINSKVNLPKVVFHKARAVKFFRAFPAVYAFCAGKAMRYWR
ncbi:hypothetical protein ALO36_102833 [Pseudomonas syringae pv. tomato]|nr:hypothetical protein ALO36_102833 [Pseudomonas syringae pv. tomato]